MTLKEDLQELALIGADPVLFMKFRMFLEMCEDDVGNEIPPVVGQQPVDNSNSDLSNE